MSNNCFPTFDGRCVSYGGRSFPSLGIEEGDSIDEVIEKLSAYILDLSGESSTASIDMSDLAEAASGCGAKIRTSTFSYEVNTTDSGGEFSYNFSKTIDALPGGYNPIRQGVEIVTKLGKVQSLIGKLNGAAFPATAFPLNVSFYADVNSNCGLIRLSKNIVVPIPRDRVETEFLIHDFGTEDLSTPKSIESAIEILTNTVAALSKKIDNRTSTRDGKSLNEILLNVESNYTALGNEIEAIPNIDPNSITNLQQQVEILSKSVANLSRENTALKTQISQIQKDLP